MKTKRMSKKITKKIKETERKILQRKKFEQHWQRNREDEERDTRMKINTKIKL